MQKLCKPVIVLKKGKLFTTFLSPLSCFSLVKFQECQRVPELRPQISAKRRVLRW
jgi:hypothetical protein